jgi:glycosyltransferase involved in cell wall biosynthesis
MNGRDRVPRILFAAEPPYRGGAEEYLLQMVLYARQTLRWSVSVVCPPRDALGSLRRDLQAAGAEVLALETTSIPASSSIRGVRRLQTYWNDFVVVRRIQKVYGQLAPDVVHVNLHCLMACRPLLLAAGLQRIPNVAVVQSAPTRLAVGRWERSRQAFLDRRGYTRWITVAEDSKRHVVETLGMPGDAVTVIPNGTELARFARTDDQIAQGRQAIRSELALSPKAILVTTVAAFNGRKGQDVLAQSIRSVKDQFPDVHFLWVGDGEQRAACEALVVALGVERLVTFTGRRSDVPDLLAASDVFVLPTFLESMPFALIEAMAAGLPCVASNVNGIPEVLWEGVQGLLVPPKSAPALTGALLSLLGNPELSARFGEAARQRSTAFSAGEMCRKTAECYQAALLMHQRKPR